MKKDLPENIVQHISVAAVLESDSPAGQVWYVYLINEKHVPIKNVMVSSRGYGIKDEKEVKTSILRHFIGDIDPHDYAKIEAIDEQVFGLTNEYWVSYYIAGIIYDKKYIFLPESIIDENLMKIPVLNKPGVLIGGIN